jgi:hypothetical protein
VVLDFVPLHKHRKQQMESAAVEAHSVTSTSGRSSYASSQTKLLCNTLQTVSQYPISFSARRCAQAHSSCRHSASSGPSHMAQHMLCDLWRRLLLRRYEVLLSYSAVAHSIMLCGVCLPFASFLLSL